MSLSGQSLTLMSSARTPVSAAREVGRVVLAPRWTWRSVVLAATITAAIYLLLPYLETRTAVPARDATLRQVDTVAPPPPPKVVREPDRAAVDRAAPAPRKPQLPELRRRLIPLQAALDLRVGLGDIGGDFSVDFAVAAPDASAVAARNVFDVEDLDTAPKPLVRLSPEYPPQARMRRLEGHVVLDFVVAADGTVRDVDVVTAVPAGVFTVAARQAVRAWRFAPGTRGGQPVPVRVRQTITFELNQ